MPIMDGLQATKILKDLMAKNTIKNASVIAVTAFSGEQSRKQCKAAGMNDYLNKPYSPNQLIKMVEKHLY